MEMNQSFLIILLRPSEKQTLYWVIKPFFLQSFSSFDNYCKNTSITKISTVNAAMFKCNRARGQTEIEEQKER